MVGFRAFSDQDRDDLVADPRTFMASIACEVNHTCFSQSIAGQPDDLTFQFLEDGPISYRQSWTRNDVDFKTRVPVFRLNKAQGGDVSFKAYIITYITGSTPSTTLGTDAPLAFTANMNGCTLGIGSQANARSAVTVTHSNSAGHGSDDANANDQHQQALGVVGVGGALLEPSVYRTHNKQAVTFGYRSRGQMWRFAYLSYHRQWGIITTYGVKDVEVQRLEI